MNSRFLLMRVMLLWSDRSNFSQSEFSQNYKAFDDGFDSYYCF